MTAIDENASRTPGRFLPVEKMWQRVGITKEESDTAYFHDLMYLGELLAKLTVAAVVALIDDDRERTRYQYAHALVRASGLGDWDSAVAEALTGPTAQHFALEAPEIIRDLTQKVGPGSWQYESARLLQEAIAILDTNAVSQQGKADGKRWITLFTRLRNKTRGHGAPTGTACSRLCPVLIEGLRLASDGLMCLRQEWAYLHRNLSGKYRVTVLSGTGAPFAYLRKSTEESIPDGVYLFLGRPRRVELVDSDVEALDFFVANGDFREQKYEMLSYISGTTRSQDGSAYVDPVGPLPGSETAGIGELDPIGKTWTNLPAAPESYIARPSLEAELLSTLQGDRYPVVTLVGRGGIGKTSLALSTLHTLARQGGFYLVLWFSARDLDLLPEGPKRVQPAVLSMRDMAKELVHLVVSETEAREKGFRAEEYLSSSLTKSPFGGPTLFVFDNFETVTSPVELYRWLDNKIRLPNKILITTRQREFRGDYPMNVSGMNEVEFSQLVDQTAGRLGIVRLLTHAYRDELFKESEGHPYVAKILLGEVAKAGKLRHVERIVADQSEILTALFERTFATLSPAAQRVFLTLSSWRATLPQLAIEAVLLRPENERIPVEEAIDELQRSSFVEIATSEGDGQAFITTPLAACIFGKRKAAVSPIKAAIEADLELLREFGAGQREDIRRGVGPRVDRLIRSIAKRVEDGKEPLERYVQMLQFIARHHRPTWFMLASLHEESPGADALKNAAEAIRQYLVDATDPNERTLGWRRLSKLYGRMNDIPGEIHALVEISEVDGAGVEEISESANRVTMLLTMLKDSRMSLESDEKKILVRKLATSLERRVDELNGTDLSRLAWLKIHLGDDRSAFKFVKIGLEREPANEHCLKLRTRLAQKFGSA
jgi:NB-ARC domain